MSAHTMIDHVSLGTTKFEDAIRFYTACLAGLGYQLEHRSEKEAAFGADGKWDFWLYPVGPDESVIGAKSHVAITADSTDKVKLFLADAVREGATQVRPAAERPDVSPDYFGTVVRDLDGHTIEVVYWRK
jgi:catechol 2,3-dioxygenase-like lactoylglutathione lyase family enzyme